jgi:hypothetical protein
MYGLAARTHLSLTNCLQYGLDSIYTLTRPTITHLTTVRITDGAHRLDGIERATTPFAHTGSVRDRVSKQELYLIAVTRKP